LGLYSLTHVKNGHQQKETNKERNAFSIMIALPVATNYKQSCYVNENVHATTKLFVLKIYSHTGQIRHCTLIQAVLSGIKKIERTLAHQHI